MVNKDRKWKVAVRGDIQYNAPICAAIGSLVVAWSINESIFMAMLQTLLHASSVTAGIVWFSQKSTVQRLEIVSRLARDQIKDENLLIDITRAIGHFRGFSGLRNRYCHAVYSYNSEMRLIATDFTDVTNIGAPIKADHKPLDLAAMNEIADITARLGKSNRELWSLVGRIQDALGVHNIELPTFPEEVSERPAPPEETVRAPAEQPPPSQE